ncbi:N-acetyltransferase [Hyphomicrobium sp.]|uniref:N-acetyltransferase n=1 Tax=Hyphomicrobium sp. TaxID=82 RepID=UPI002D79049C|nr:N-acetyltransferase [Hyphomicrobium sp.]HET6387989.1 N-acetyltransferase [Hyphomicrobium sp.]
MSQLLDRAEATYARLIAQQAKSDFAPVEAETRLGALVRDQPLVKIYTQSGRTFFVRRALSDSGITYRVFRTELSAIIGEEAIGICEVGRMMKGIARIRRAEVQGSYQRKGIATAVYDLVCADMIHAGGLLWPVSPREMNDAQFKVWWRRSPVLVFYYPHRHRLGLKPRFEFEELFEGARKPNLWDQSRYFFQAVVSRLGRILRLPFA